MTVWLTIWTALGATGLLAGMAWITVSRLRVQARPVRVRRQPATAADVAQRMAWCRQGVRVRGPDLRERRTCRAAAPLPQRGRQRS